jgi:hypothetical protein
MQNMGGAGAGGLPEEMGTTDPNALMQRETMSQAHHAEFNIQREREYEKLQ